MKEKIKKVSRDYNILKCYQGEVNLQTKSVKDKTKYSRKTKHSKKSYEVRA